MQSYLASQNEPWLELVLVLTGGTAVIAGLATLTAPFVRSAIWQRTIWQIATFGVLTLMVVELTGTGPAWVRLWLAETDVPTARPGNAPAKAGEPSPAAESPAEANWSVAAAADLAWFDEMDYGRDDAWDRPFYTAAEDVPHENEIEETLHQAIAPGEEPEHASQSVLQQSATGGLPAGASRETGGETLADPPPSGPAAWLLGAIWALGAMVIAVRIVFARVLMLSFWRRRTRVSEGPLCQCVDRLARRLGIRRKVPVLEAAGLSAPVAFGSFRPTVALPATFADDFDRQQQEAVLAHELAHLAARDPAWQALANLLCAALWWHPLVWWLRHRLRAASEAAADEASLLVPDGPDLLADCLVSTGRRLTLPRELGWLSFEGPGFRSGLGRRVERLLNLRTRPWRAPGRGRMVLAKTTLPVALVIVAVCCTAWARPQATLTEGETTMNVLRTSWRRSLAAAALALFTAGCSEAVADDPATEESTPAVVGEDLADADGQLALLGEDEEAEAREREELERDEAEAREREEQERDEVERRERREREEREEDVQREFKTDRDRLANELRGLEERAHDIKRELEGLRDGQDAEARELQGALREIDVRMGAIRRELRGPQRDRERRDLDERARLEDRLGILTMKHEMQSRQAADYEEAFKQDHDDEQARRLQEGLREVRAEIERTADEMSQVMQRLGRHPDRPRGDRVRPEPPPEPPHAGTPEDLMRRIHHMEVAIENLHAAGLHEQAEQLAVQMDRMARLAVQMDRMARHPGRGDPPPQPPPPPREPREQPPHPELGQRLGQQDRAIHELNAAVKQLREEMGQMREMLQELLERQKTYGSAGRL